MRLRRPGSARTATASVEFAVVLSTVLVPLMIGTWEVGRPRPGAADPRRGDPRRGADRRPGADHQPQGHVHRGRRQRHDPNNPDVYSAVQNHLNAAGINTTGLTVTFSFLDSSGNPISSPNMPYLGTKGQPFRVTSTLPYTSFRWITTNMFNITQAKSCIDWVSMIDDPYTVNTTLPTWTGY